MGFTVAVPLSPLAVHLFQYKKTAMAKIDISAACGGV
jgi:hypothetical protein